MARGRKMAAHKDSGSAAVKRPYNNDSASEVSTRSSRRALATDQFNSEIRGSTSVLDEVPDVSLIYRKPPRRRGQQQQQQQSSHLHEQRESTAHTAHLLAPHMSTAASGSQARRGVGVPESGVTTSSLHSRKDTQVRLEKADMEGKFWHRCASIDNLVTSLSSCDACAVTSAAAAAAESNGVDYDSCSCSTGSSAGGSRAPMPLFSIGEDRFRTALQALLDLKALIVASPAGATADKKAEGEKEGGSAVAAGAQLHWVRASHWKAAVALAFLSEAAIPPRSAPLVALDTYRDHKQGQLLSREGDDLDAWVPAPVSLSAVADRLESVRRLWRLRVTYGVLAPAVRQCSSAEALSHLLFSHSPQVLQELKALEALRSSRKTKAPARGEDKADLVPPSVSAVLRDALIGLPGVSLRHQCETLLLEALLKRANGDCGVDVNSWGPMGRLGQLQLSDGVYVSHYMPRALAMRSLLQAGELYGIPPFLRSIRRSQQQPQYQRQHDYRGSSSSSSGIASSTVLPPASMYMHYQQQQHRQHQQQYLLFLSPDSLDPAQFETPDPMQYAIVQEELIGLAMRHCGFGFIIGEADEVLYLVKETTEYLTSLWERRLKREEALMGKLDGGSDGHLDAVKPERSSEETEAMASKTFNHPLRDPLALYARRTAACALAVREQELQQDEGVSASAAHHTSSSSKSGLPPFTVEWLCKNRWTSSTSYYGIVYGVVLPDDAAGLEAGVAPGTSVDVEDSQGMDPLKNVSYYMSCVVELRRQ